MPRELNKSERKELGGDYNEEERNHFIELKNMSPKKPFQSSKTIVCVRVENPIQADP